MTETPSSTIAVIGRRLVNLLTLAATIVLLALPPVAARAAETPETQATAVAAPPEKVGELLKLLDDPSVRNQVRALLELLDDPSVKAWLQQNRAAAPPAPAPRATSRWSGAVADRMTGIDNHLVGIVAAAPRLPAEFKRAGDILVDDFGERGLVEILLLLVGFVGFGFGAEWVFLRLTEQARARIGELSLATVRDRLWAVAMRLLFGLAQVLAFAAGSVGAFLTFRWPVFLKEIVLGYLLAFLALRIMLVVGRFLLSPDVERFRIIPISTEAAWFWYRRLGVMVAWFSFGLVTSELLELLEFNLPSRQLVAYVLGLGLLAAALELVWRRPTAVTAETATRRLRPGARKGLISACLLALWLLWVAGAMPVFWFAVIAVALPAAIGLAERSVNHVLRPPGSQAALPSVATVCVERGVRALLIAGAVLLLARAWHVDLVELTSDGDNALARLVGGALSGVVIVLVADFGWQLLKAVIDAKLGEAASTDEAIADEMRARRQRLLTLLPILRNVLFLVIWSLTALMRPRRARCRDRAADRRRRRRRRRVGFGAQTLVKDVISGMFYLARRCLPRRRVHRRAATTRGPWNRSALRSVKLRHHRGPLYTVRSASSARCRT